MKILVPGLLLMGGAFILSIYHLILYLQYKEKIILTYTQYLFFNSAYIAAYLIADYYFPHWDHQFVYYVKESMNVAAIISYCYFLKEAAHSFIDKFSLVFKIFRGISFFAIVYCIFVVIAGIIPLDQHFIIRVLPLAVRTLLLGFGIIVMPFLFPYFKGYFLQLIKWGALIYLLIVIMIMIINLRSGKELLGLEPMQLFFLGTFIDIIVFSLAMGYKIKSVFSEIMGMRLRIAKDLHDDVGATLTGIKVFSQLAKERPEIRHLYLDKINMYSEEMLNKMSDIIWTINADNDSFDHIITKLRDYALTITAAKNIHLNFDIDTDIRNSKLDMNLRKNIFLIGKEALNNAIKYAECSTINLILKPNNSGAKLTISDDGKGFDKELKHEGNGLYNMQQRTEEVKGQFEIQSSPGKGTAINVSFNFT